MQLTQLAKQSGEEKSNLVVYTPEQKDTLNHALGACLVTQRTYGKQATDMEKALKVFIRVLSDYEPEKVIQAIKKWLLTSPDFPTPADILNILNPQPKFDYAVYNALNDRLKRGEKLDYSQMEYIKAYEKNALKGF